jgi:hypothetical protein
MRVNAAAPFQVSHDGIIYRPGDTAEVPDDVGQQWICSGWAVQSDAAQPGGRRRRTDCEGDG